MRNIRSAGYTANLNRKLNRTPVKDIYDNLNILLKPFHIKNKTRQVYIVGATRSTKTPRYWARREPKVFTLRPMNTGESVSIVTYGNQ
jgi:hypothetical protein